MEPNELLDEAARRMERTVNSVVALKGTELSPDYVKGYCQGCLDYLETLRTIITEQN